VVTRQIVESLVRWFECNARDLPWRRTRDPYAIWVSEVMLQQTQVKTVLPYWEQWMRSLPNLQALASAKLEKIHKLWEGLGYYTRVRNLQKAARQIVERHKGRFPENYEEILAMPGVGPYTAGAICSIAFNQPKPILDGNLVRVLSRLFGIRADPRTSKVKARLWQLAERLVRCAAEQECAGKQEAGSRNASRDSDGCGACSALNQALMELGALICRPRQAHCDACPLTRFCFAFRHDCVESLPALRRRPGPTPRRFAAFLCRNGEKILVRQRPNGVVNAHLWELPNVELAPGEADIREAAQRALGASPKVLERFMSIRHSITRYRITLDVFRTANTHSAKRPAGCRWAKPSDLRLLPFTSAHKKILDRIYGC
jgi:A/G-specific adenine glycosylase